MPSDPYRSPSSEPSAPTERPAKRFNLFAAILIFVFAVVSNLALRGLSGRYASLFEDFGSELPVLTQAFLPDSGLYFVFPLLCALGFAVRWAAPRFAAPVFITCGVGSALMVPMFFFAMYLPIFSMGAVV